MEQPTQQYRQFIAHLIARYDSRYARMEAASRKNGTPEQFVQPMARQMLESAGYYVDPAYGRGDDASCVP